MAASRELLLAWVSRCAAYPNSPGFPFDALAFFSVRRVFDRQITRNVVCVDARPSHHHPHLPHASNAYKY